MSRKAVEACPCGWLRTAADDADVPICYVAQFNEFHLAYQSDNRQGTLVVRYCPSCGGAAPPPTREHDYYEVTSEELQRLFKLASGITSTNEAISRFGTPDEESTVTFTRNADSKSQVFRAFVFNGLSSVAKVMLVDYGPGRTLGVKIAPKHRTT